MSIFIRSVLVSSLLLLLLPSAHAGPACARRNRNSSICRAKCAHRWGWPGSTYGTDPWGPVVTHSASADSASLMPPNACGSSTPASAVGQGTTPPSTLANPEALPSSAQASTSRSAYSERPSTAPHSTYSPPAAPHSSSPPPPAPKPVQTQSSSPPADSPPANSPPANSQPKSSSQVSPPKQSAASPPPISTSAPAPPASGNTPDESQYLQYHNSIRSQHGAQPLSWNDTLASKAQQWADGCKFVHSGGSLGPFGENLAAGTGSSYGIPQAVQSWTNEASQYDPSNPQPSHFTQVVWKGSSQVGCALQECSGIFAASFGLAQYVVCEYFPQGNIIGNFAQNVQV